MINNKNMHKNKHYVLLPLFSAVTILSAITYVLVLNNSLSPSDSAYGQTITETFKDHFVRDIFVSFILASIIIGYPLFYIAARNLNLPKAIPIILIAVILEIAIVTPVHAGAGLILSYLALIISITICRFSLSDNRKITASNKSLQ